MTTEDVDEARALGKIRDPFDRAVAATSVRIGVPLLTRDTVLKNLRAVRTVW
jgi:PIN domain nuclease of toxin-antitoxin system